MHFVRAPVFSYHGGVQRGYSPFSLWTGACRWTSDHGLVGFPGAGPC